MITVDTIRVVLYIVCIVPVLFGLYYINRKDNPGKTPSRIILVIAGILLVSSVDWFVNTGFDYVSEHFPAYLSAIIVDAPTTSEKKEDIVEGHVHVVSESIESNVVAATCTNTGSYDLIKVCKCGEELSRESMIIEVLEHDYRSHVTPPTCTQQGYTTLTCSMCNHSYVDEYAEAIGHNYKDGICVICGSADPSYEKVYSSEEIMRILDQYIVSDSGAYEAHLGSNSISVFAEDRYNCFSINTLVSYNLWGHNVQEVKFNISHLNDIDFLVFKVGGQTGASGSVCVEIYIDKDIGDSPDYTYNIEASGIPIEVTPIDITNATSMAIRVTNNSGKQNRIVFFDFSEIDGE